MPITATVKNPAQLHTAKTSLTYTGAVQALVNAGKVTGGKLYYSTNYNPTDAVGNGTWVTDASSITGTNANTYTVYYKVVGDALHANVDPTPITVTIAKAKVTVPSAQTNLVYNGTTQTGVVLPANAKYTLSGNTATNASSSHSATATLSDKNNYEWNLTTATSNDQTITWAIAPLTVTVSWTNTELTYNGQTQQPTATVTNKIGTDVVNVTVSGGQANAGTSLTATATALTGAAAANYKLPETAPTTTYSIAKAAQTAPAVGEGITVDYVNEKITPDSGYEVSTTRDDNFATGKLSGETDIVFGTTYYVRKVEDNNHNASEETPFSFTRPAAPAASAFTMTGETVENKKDGSFSGITAAMEYSTDNGTTWAPGPKTLTGLSNETVKVRYKARTEAFKSEEYSYTFEASTAKLTVSFGDDAESQQLAYDAKVLKPADPTKTGYTFGGWYSDEELTQAWNFDVDTVTDNMTLYPKWIRNNVQKAVITGNVTEDSSNVIGATVELFLGTVKVAATVTNDSGNYSFDNVEDGIYNIVVTKADGKTKTELVTVDRTGSFSVNVVLPASAVNSIVEVEDTQIGEAKSEISKTVVGGLDTIAAAQNPKAGQTITIKLIVEAKDASDVASASEIKALAGSGKKVEFLDLSLTKTVDGTETPNFGDKNTQLLTIVIPFDFSGVNVSSVMILRQHGTDNVEKLTKNPVTGQEGYVVDAQAGTITLYAMKFSDYAVAYKEQSGNGGGSYAPGHTVTSDLKNVTKVTIDGKVVDSRYYTVSGGNIILSGEFMKTLANGKHTVKLYDGAKVATGIMTVSGNVAVISAATGDMGVALYAALSVSSILGMGWVGKKKRGEE